MKRYNTIFSGLVLLALVASTAGCGWIQKLQARDQLNKGVNAFRNANYPQSIERFKRAIQLDPGLINARLYLASAYMSQFVPGAESEENKRNAEAAAKGFQDVLERDSNNQAAIRFLGFLAYSQKNFDEAKKWYTRLIQLNPQNKEAYYTIGVMNYWTAFQSDAEARAKTHMQPDDSGPIKDKKVREQLKEKNEAVIREGLDQLEKALQIDQNYEDAMLYVSLLYRQQADIVDTAEESKKLEIQANDLMQKTLEMKKKKTEGATPKTG